MKIGVLSNPLSRRNLNGLREVNEFLTSHGDVVHKELADFASLKIILGEFALADVRLLVINAGDGTVSAVLTEIFEHSAFPDIPWLAVLPGGTSNTIAGDVGLPGNRIKSLRRLISVVERGVIDQHSLTRPLIRVRYDLEMPAVIGMFFGTASICDAISLRRRMFPQKWIPDPIASVLTLGYVLGRFLFGCGGALRGYVIGIDLETGSEPERRFSILMVTTLRRIFLGGSPFWGDGDGRLKFTSIRSPASGLVGNAYRILYGRDKRKLPEAIYRSASVDKIVLRMRCRFNLDGEFFEPAANTDVTLTSPNAGRFVQC